MSLEDSNRNPPPPAFVNPTPGATGNSTSGEVPAPVQNPAFRGPPTPAAPGGGYQPVEAQRHRSHEPPPIVTDPSPHRTPGSPVPDAGQSEPPVVSLGSPNPRRGRFNQTLALADYQRPPTSAVPAVPPLGTADAPGGFQPAAVGDAVLTQAPGTELGGGDPNATAAVAAVPPELQRYLDEQQRLVEARAAGRPVENVATPPATVPAQQIYTVPPVQSPAGFPVQAAYAVPAQPSPAPAQPSPAPAQSPFAAPFTSQSSYGGSPQPLAAASVQPAFVQPAFVQPRPASYESPSAAPFTPPPAAAGARPVPTSDQPFVSSVPSRPPPGSPWPAAIGDSTFERDLASLPGPRAPGQRSPSTPSPAAPAAPKEPVIAVKWAALIAIATFVVGMMLGMTMYSML